MEKVNYCITTISIECTCRSQVINNKKKRVRQKQGMDVYGCARSWKFNYHGLSDPSLVSQTTCLLGLVFAAPRGDCTCVKSSFYCMPNANPKRTLEGQAGKMMNAHEKGMVNTRKRTMRRTQEV